MKKYLYFFLFFSQISCIKVEKEFITPSYSFYGVIDPNQEIFSLFVGKVYKLYEPFPIDSGKAISYAKISIKNTSTGESKLMEFNFKSKKFELKNGGFFLHDTEYQMEAQIETQKYLSAVTIPEKIVPVISYLVKENGQVSIETKWLKQKKNETFYRLLGAVNFGDIIFTPFYWNSTPNIWRGKNLASGLINAPTGFFEFVGNSTSASVSILIESQDQNWADFSTKIDNVQNRNEFSKKFEAPIFFQSNIKNGFGIFGAKTSSQILIEIKK